MSDADAFEHYDDPANREPGPGAPRRRADRTLRRHVPVRFAAETIEEIRRVAEADGLTVSAWIRRAVDRALRREGVGAVEGVDGGDDTRRVVERLQRDVADLAAALERVESR